MNSLSVCMIVKNEEDVLERVLSAVIQFADEIIIVDTGSNDNTKSIARKYTDKIYDFVWCDDFALARNFSFSKATKDYIMWLDADDIVTDDNIAKIKGLMENIDADMVMCLYNVGFDHQNKATFCYYRERILRRAYGYMWEGFVHEAIPPSGKVVYNDIAIEHRSIKSSGDRNLKIYQKKIKDGIKLLPRHQFYYGRELYQNGKIQQAQKVLTSFLKEESGFIENKIDACLLLKRIADNFGDREKGMRYVLSVLEFALPNAEICYEIGEYFMHKQKYPLAIHWFREALRYTPDIRTGAFVNKDYHGLLPSLGLCFCYYNMGDKKSAKRYNNLAEEFCATDTRVIYNKQYFDTLD